MRHGAVIPLLVLTACGAATSGTGLTDGVMELPAVLREVSGVCVVDAHTIACVQDEVGALFFVDLNGVEPLRALPFGEPADWEAVARAGDDWWVLRSDGYLARLGRRDAGLAIVASTWLPGGPREWEALCYDADRSRLLAMPKQGLDDGKEGRDARAIFAIEPRTLEVAPTPVLEFTRRGLIRQAEARGIELPTRTTDKGKVRVDLGFACSELIALPGKNEFLLLLANDGALVRIDAEGRLLACGSFDRDLLPQAEGMVLLPDGRLLLASEGVAGRGRIAVVPMP